MRRFFSLRRAVAGFVLGFFLMPIWSGLWDSIGPGDSTSVLPYNLVAKMCIGGVVGILVLSFGLGRRRADGG